MVAHTSKVTEIIICRIKQGKIEEGFMYMHMYVAKRAKRCNGRGLKYEAKMAEHRLNVANLDQRMKFISKLRSCHPHLMTV
jgi:hypothetical protein